MCNIARTHDNVANVPVFYTSCNIIMLKLQTHQLQLMKSSRHTCRYCCIIILASVVLFLNSISALNETAMLATVGTNLLIWLNNFSGCIYICMYGCTCSNPRPRDAIAVYITRYTRTDAYR